jgi:hypothetical protein
LNLSRLQKEAPILGIEHRVPFNDGFKDLDIIGVFPSYLNDVKHATLAEVVQLLQALVALALDAQVV